MDLNGHPPRVADLESIKASRQGVTRKKKGCFNRHVNGRKLWNEIEIQVEAQGNIIQLDDADMPRDVSISKAISIVPIHYIPNDQNEG